MGWGGNASQREERSKEVARGENGGVELAKNQLIPGPSCRSAS